jgi:hypothetical protein
MLSLSGSSHNSWLYVLYNWYIRNMRKKVTSWAFMEMLNCSISWMILTECCMKICLFPISIAIMFWHQLSTQILKLKKMLHEETKSSIQLRNLILSSSLSEIIVEAIVTNLAFVISGSMETSVWCFLWQKGLKQTKRQVLQDDD